MAPSDVCFWKTVRKLLVVYKESTPAFACFGLNCRPLDAPAQGPSADPSADLLHGLNCGPLTPPTGLQLSFPPRVNKAPSLATVQQPW